MRQHVERLVRDLAGELAGAPSTSGQAPLAGTASFEPGPTSRRAHCKVLYPPQLGRWMVLCCGRAGPTHACSPDARDLIYVHYDAHPKRPVAQVSSTRILGFRALSRSDTSLCFAAIPSPSRPSSTGVRDLLLAEQVLRCLHEARGRRAPSASGSASTRPRRARTTDCPNAGRAAAGHIRLPQDGLFRTRLRGRPEARGSLPGRRRAPRGCR